MSSMADLYTAGPSQRSEVSSHPISIADTHPFGAKRRPRRSLGEGGLHIKLGDEKRVI
jgi:hypothetical protein